MTSLSPRFTGGLIQLSTVFPFPCWGLVHGYSPTQGGGQQLPPILLPKPTPLPPVLIVAPIFLNRNSQS